jgi:hypothetical protein
MKNMRLSRRAFVVAGAAALLARRNAAHGGQGNSGAAAGRGSTDLDEGGFPGRHLDRGTIGWAGLGKAEIFEPVLARALGRPAGCDVRVGLPAAVNMYYTTYNRSKLSHFCLPPAATACAGRPKLGICEYRGALTTCGLDREERHDG